MVSGLKHIDQITANNVALRDQYIVVGGDTIRLPQPPELRLSCQREQQLPTLGRP